MTTPTPAPAADPTPAPAPGNGDGNASAAGPVPATTANETAPAPVEAPDPPTDPTAVAETLAQADVSVLTYDEEPEVVTGDDGIERVLAVGAKGDVRNPGLKPLVDERTGEVIEKVAQSEDEAEAAAEQSPAANNEEKPNG